MKIARLGWGVTVATLALVAGCNRDAPKGQVVATVNGEDVTQQELNTELGSTNVAQGMDKQEAQRLLLQRVIERKLVDGLAKQRNIDSSPEYLAQRRRLDEILLAQLYAKQQLAAVAVPSGADITKFMGDNAGMFSARQQLLLDQIRFARPANVSVLNGLDAVHSLDGVAAFLREHGVKFDRQAASLDSAALPAPLLAQVNRLPAGEPFVIPAGGLLTINVVTGRKAVANDPQQARAVAAQAWRSQKQQQALADQIAAARKSATITYQKGFAPAAGAPGAPAPAKP